MKLSIGFPWFFCFCRFIHFILFISSFLHFFISSPFRVLSSSVCVSSILLHRVCLFISFFKSLFIFFFFLLFWSYLPAICFFSLSLFSYISSSSSSSSSSLCFYVLIMMMVMMIIIISGASELKGRRFRIDTSGLIANYFYTDTKS